MRSGKDLYLLIGTALLAGAALSIAAYAIGSGTTTVVMMSVAIIALALAQLTGLFRGYGESSNLQTIIQSQADLANGIMSLSNESRRVSNESQHTMRDVAQLRDEASALNVSLQESFAALRQSHEGLSLNIKTIMDSQSEIQEQLAKVPAAPVWQPSPQLHQAIEREQQWVQHMTAPMEDVVEEPQYTAPPPPEPAFESTQFGEQLNLALEPIVDLYTSNTAHYRMVLGMTNEQGKDVVHDLLVMHADRMGLRDKLDPYVVQETMGLLEQLRQRDQSLCIFVPVGAATLSNPLAVQSILEHIRNHPDVTSGLVLDLSHAVLASLPETSLEGLATLARAGVVLSLSQASIAGLDLSALNRLNVRFISLAAATVGVGLQISAGLPGLVQSARALRIQTIISHVGDPRHVGGLAKIARLASGPAFAVPRKLKRNLPEQHAQHLAA
jgi:EAL domain-containing protein (putative c-di-GMP-specific phosphodiesterase class I)/chaperonin cofactor prefoldin